LNAGESATVAAKSIAFALDSFALLAHFEDEAGGRRVKASLAQAAKQRAEILLSLINYGEVVYITEREQGLRAAQRVISAIDRLPITIVDADRRLTLAAAHIKAHHAVSYADAFAIALAQERHATLLTADPEFRTVESLVSIEWLPAA
jgi:predicted nucleic acid-binding protein